MKEHLRRRIAEHAPLRAHVCYSRPRPQDRPGQDYDSEGRMTGALLQRLLEGNDYDFYLCGPLPFMTSLYDDLRAWGVPEARIHSESFGLPAALRQTDSTGTASPVEVTFARAGVTAAWDGTAGSLLDLAEAQGLKPPAGCRAGLCHACACPLLTGEVEYPEALMAPPEPGQVLICSARPRGLVVVDL